MQALEIPLDECGTYVKSFQVTDNRIDIETFFDKFGFVIFRDIISYDECRELANDMVTLLVERGNESVQRGNMNTWGSGLTKYGMPKATKAIFRHSLLNFRQNANIYTAFSHILQEDDIRMSHDRWLIHLPATDGIPLTSKSVHLDMNPWEYQNETMKDAIYARLNNLSYASGQAFLSENNDVHKSMGRCVQGLVTLSDITTSDAGGTILIPGFHKYFETWLSEADVNQQRVGPMQYKLSRDDKLFSYAQHVTLRPGSLLIWDQRCFHGSTPNLGPLPRVGIPLRAFSAKLMSVKRSRDRSQAIKAHLRRLEFEPSALGNIVFGQ
jgi:ectoine hydroxylase-related dioxygenase (phytanoyl-CoA dioxygenase family)